MICHLKFLVRLCSAGEWFDYQSLSLYHYGRYIASSSAVNYRSASGHIK